MQENKRNCVGFVYYWLGIILDESYVEPPSLEKFKRTFTRTDNINEADAIAVIIPSDKGPMLYHIALVSPDKKTILHRNGTGGPVLAGKVEDMRDYTTNDEAEVIFLKYKKKKSW
jgi:hypothetical protein